MDFKSLHDELHNKKVQYQQLTIPNIFKIIFNVNEKENSYLFKCLHLMSESLIIREGNNYGNKIVKIDKTIEDIYLENDQRSTNKKNDEKKLKENVFINKTSDCSKNLEMDSDLTLSDDWEENNITFCYFLRIKKLFWDRLICFGKEISYVFNLQNGCT